MWPIVLILNVVKVNNLLLHGAIQFFFTKSFFMDGMENKSPSECPDQIHLSNKWQQVHDMKHSNVATNRRVFTLLMNSVSWSVSTLWGTPYVCTNSTIQLVASLADLLFRVCWNNQPLDKCIDYHPVIVSQGSIPTSSNGFCTFKEQKTNTLIVRTCWL